MRVVVLLWWFHQWNSATHRINQTVCWSMLSNAYRRCVCRLGEWSFLLIDPTEPTFLNLSSMPTILHLYQQKKWAGIPTLHSSIVPEWKKDAFRVRYRIEALLQLLWGIIHNPKLQRVERKTSCQSCVVDDDDGCFCLQGAFGFVFALTRVVNSKCPSSLPSGRSRSVNASLYSSCARSDNCWQ